MEVPMISFTGIMALVALLSFGTATIAFSQAPAQTPAPTDDDKDKTKKPETPKVFAGDEKKDEKKDMGGK
jgi:hypothetical protein